MVLDTNKVVLEKVANLVRINPYSLVNFEIDREIKSMDSFNIYTFNFETDLTIPAYSESLGGRI